MENVDHDEAARAWVMLDTNHSFESVVQMLKIVAKSQVAMSHAMQQLLTQIDGRLCQVEARCLELDRKLELLTVSSHGQNVQLKQLKSEVEALREQLTDLDGRVLERDVRHLNQKIRSGLPFTFSSTKTPL